MEDIRSDLDRIFAKFNESYTHSAPKKLNFEHLNDSLNIPHTASKKRRISELNEDSPIPRDNVSSQNCNPPPKEVVASSPWDIRRLRADLLEAKTRIAGLKDEMDRQSRISMEKQTLAEKKVTELIKQCEFSSNKVIDIEKRLEVLRKREQSTKQELLKTQSELNQLKIITEEENLKIKQEKDEIEKGARATQNALTNQLSSYRQRSNKVELELQFTMEELDKIRKQLEEYKERASTNDELSVKCEKQQQELDCANSRIKELEYRISTYDDWKEITEKAQARLLNVTDMGKELERLKTNNKNLYDVIGNKLLLEEQIHDYKTRLDKEEGAAEQLVGLQVQYEQLQKELKEWIKIAEDHCGRNTTITPMALRTRIEQLLEKDIIMVSEKNESMSQCKAKEDELLEYKQKCEIYAKNVDSLNFALKRHKTFKERVQKKLLLVSKERDFYKQLLENIEKDLTVSQFNTTEVSSLEVQLRARVDMLEKTLAGYKDICAKFDKDQSRDPFEGFDTYDNLKKDMDKLRLENERLQRRKECLELELEQHRIRSLAGDEFRPVHFIQNPASLAYENNQNMVEKLQAQIERYKRCIKQLEEENELTQARLNETTNMTVNIKELNQIRAELESANGKMKKLKELFKTKNMEFRDTCYQLFGYKIDCDHMNRDYKLYSMYAENSDDYLHFMLNEENQVIMLGTAYSLTLQDLVDTHLTGYQSLPTFLSTLTLELFQRQTMTNS